MNVKVVRYTPEQVQRELADLYVIAEQARADMARYAKAEARLAAVERRIEGLEYLAGHATRETGMSDYQAGYQAGIQAAAEAVAAMLGHPGTIRRAVDAIHQLKEGEDGV